MPRKLTFPSLLRHCTLLALGLVAYHLVLRWLMTQHGLRLGAVSYKLVPLYAYWRPHVKGWLLVPVAVLSGYFWILRRTRVATSMTNRSAIAFFVLSFLGIVSSVAMLDGGPRSLIEPLLRTDLEYFGAVDRVHGVGEFLRDYCRFAHTMPMHAQVHPPGAVLFMWAACKLFGGGPWAAAAAIIAVTSLSVIPVFAWAHRLGGPGVARRAAAIYVLTPSVVLFTATSMDGPFAAFLIAAMWLFWESLEHRPVVFGLLAGLATAAASLMTYSVTVAMLFCGIAASMAWWSRPTGRRATASAAIAAMVGFAGLNIVLWLSTGFDPIQMFCTAITNSNHIMTGTRHESLSRYVHIAVGNLVVFFIAAGLPCMLLWVPTIVSVLKRFNAGSASLFFGGYQNSSAECPNKEVEAVPSRSSELFILSASLTLLVAASVPVYVLEVERVWMFLIPLVVIPVAQQLIRHERATGKVHGTLVVASLLATQTVVTEVLLSTYW